MYPMSAMEAYFLWLGGFSPRTLINDSPQEREPIAKLGATVQFAALVAAINWAVGGWTYAVGMATDVRMQVAAITSLLGVFLVLAFDRGLIYAIDVAGKIGWMRLSVYSIFRVVIVMAISSLTSQAVIPLLLGNELSMTALKMQEAAEAERISKLGTQFRVETVESAASDAAKEVERLAREAATLPPDIVEKLAASKRCWNDYRAQRANLIKQGAEPKEATDKLRGRFRTCTENERIAKSEQTAYLSKAKQNLARATEAKQEADNEVRDTRNGVKERINTARNIESSNLTAHSSTVLYQTLENNPAALGKWLLITLILLICELLPLLYKLQMGQTPPGRRIAAETELSQRKLEAEIKQKQHYYDLQEEIIQASQEGVKAAMATPEVHKVFAESFAQALKTLAPSEAMAALMHDLQERGPDIKEFSHRHPHYAQVIADAWQYAVEQTSRIIGAGTRIKPPTPATANSGAGEKISA